MGVSGSQRRVKLGSEKRVEDGRRALESEIGFRKRDGEGGEGMQRRGVKNN